MGVPIDLPKKKKAGGSTKSSSSKPSSRGENIKLMDTSSTNTAADLLAEQSEDNIINVESMPVRNDDANYIKKVSQGEPRQSNESKAQDKIAKMFEDTYAPEGDAFFNMGYGLRKAFDKKRQAKAEKAGFDNIADYKGAMKEERQVNKTDRKQERKEGKQAKRANKTVKASTTGAKRIEKKRNRVKY